MRTTEANLGQEKISVTLKISEDDLEKYISLLQSGVDIRLAAGEPLGVFLERLPDFTPDYINDEVQTIFLNGTALDDINTPLCNDTVIALSAAMPGLSGAIYRRNSIHSTLRSVQHEAQTDIEEKDITVRVKLFNAIARDRGPQLLREGVCMDAGRIRAFFRSRPWLLDRMLGVEINASPVSESAVLLRTLEQTDSCKLTVCTVSKVES